MKLNQFWINLLWLNLISIFLVPIFSCSKHNDIKQKNVIPVAAWIGDTVITNDEMISALRDFIVKRGIEVPTSELEKQEIRRQCLREMAQQLILKREGEKRGIHLNENLSDPGEVLNQSVDYPEGFQLLEKDKQLWKRSVKQDFILLEISARLAEEFSKNIDIPDELVKKYYEQNLSEYIIPEILSVRMIRVFDQDLAKDIRKKLKRGWNFLKLAETYSTLRNRGAKGKLIRQPLSEFPKEFQAELQALKIRQISPILYLDESYYIFKLEKKEPAKTKPFDEVSDDIRKELISQKANALFRSWLDEQLAELTIKMGTPVPFPGETL